MNQPISSLVSVLMRRDDLSQSEAEKLVNDAKRRVRNGENPEEILYEDFGLEPDYFFDLVEGII